MNILNLEELKAVEQVAPNSIINADCLEAMKYIADKSIDCIICDLPYGITSCKWDTVIPFELLWEQYKRIIKPNGAIALFGSQPFSSALVMSNPKWFKYEWIWEKPQGTGSFNANRRPLSSHENICVFANGRSAYYPQKTEAKTLRRNKTHSKTNLEYTSVYRSGGNYQNKQLWKETGFRYPKSVLKFAKNSQCVFGVYTAEAEFKHPSKKPVPLIEYLIKTYTLEGELILDNTAGSGTLAIAAINTNRRYICIEKDERYFEVMRNRIESHDPNAVKPKSKSRSQKETVSDKYVQLSLFGN